MSTVRVALDLLGGDAAPDAVVEGALLAVAEQPGLSVVLVGPPEVAERLLGGPHERVSVVAASQVVGMDEDPARAVRAKRDATVRVAAKLVKDGEADAVVSLGNSGATLTAAVLVLNRVRGVSRPPLAAVIPSTAGPLVFLDAGGTVESSTEQLVQFALVGAAYAQVRLGLEAPRVGLLTVGEEAGKGDRVRKEAHTALAAALEGSAAVFVGNVEGHDVPGGGQADVVVTDGFTGNVLAKGLEGAAVHVGAAVRARLEAAGAPPALLDEVDRATAPLQPELMGGAVLLGVKGVVVVGHGASRARGVASCLRTAVETAREDLVARTATALEMLRPAAQTQEDAP